MDRRANEDNLRVGAVAKAAGVGVQTLHYYERLGLLPKPCRSDANYRLYSPEAIRRVRFIKKAQALGITDRLSEEEAGIIAARLIRRVEAKTPLPKEKAQEFQHELAESWSKCVTSGKHIASRPGDQPTCRFEDVGEDIARKYLNQEQLKFWKEAVEGGGRPLPNES